MKDASPSGGNAANGDSKGRSICDRFTKAMSRVNQWRSTWQEAHDYALPNRQGFEDQTVGERRNTQIFDETAVVGVPRFASRLQVGFFPPHGRAFRLEPGPSLPKSERTQTAQRKLDEITDLIHQALRQSNFNAELHEALQDLAIGTGTLLVQGGSYPGEIVCQSVPLTQLALVEGPRDYPEAWFRHRKVKLKDLTSFYPRAKPSDDLQRKITDNPELQVTVIDATERDWSNKGTETYRWTVVVKDYQATIETGKVQGEGSAPMISFRWSKAANEVYGRGPLLLAMPAIKTCNLTMQLILENAEMAIGGLWTYDDDGVFNPDNVTLAPGTFLPKATGSEIAPLQSAAQFDVGQLILEDMRGNIRKALFIDELEKQGKTPLSATEVAERTADVARDMGAVAGRLQSEFLQPLVRRIVHILTQQGMIELPRVDGQEIKITPQSPLLRAQNMQDISDFMRFQETLQATYGEAAMLMTKQGEGAQYLAEKFGIPANLVNSPEEIQQLLQEMKEQAQANPDLAGGGKPDQVKRRAQNGR